jgi:hypothetical protein
LVLLMVGLVLLAYLFFTRRSLQAFGAVYRQTDPLPRS